MSEHRVRVTASPSPGGGTTGGPLAVTPGWIERDGRPAIGISATLDYSRIPPAQWAGSLRRTRQAGVTAVATTVFWNHHEAERGSPDFTGRLDLRGFVTAARAAGLDVMLRIGPWVHARARHGGLPDWLLALPVRPRTDDEGYLAEVARWFGLVAGQVAGIALLGIQVEQEFAGDPAHLASLRRLAQEAGLEAPLWTTVGGGEPPEGIVPVAASHPEAHWLDAAAGRYATTDFSYAPPRVRTLAEIATGTAAAGHRRPFVTAADVAALALTRLGAGSAWQSYALFHDGRNPAAHLQEAHANGEPNDLAGLDDECGGPLGIDGHRRESWYRLRLQHLFLAAWGPRLATMPATVPQRAWDAPQWAVRSDGRSGFLFVTNHAPGVAVETRKAAALTIETLDGEVSFPAVDIPGGSAFIWPFRLAVGDSELVWATAQPVALLPWRGTPLLILAEVPGIPARSGWRRGVPLRVGGHGPGEWAEIVHDGVVTAHCVVLAQEQAWRLGLPDGLTLGERGLRDLARAPAALPPVRLEPVRYAGTPPTPVTGPLGRASVPLDWTGAARVAVSLEPVPEATLVLDWEGDAARLWEGERLVADALYSGREWRIGAPDLAGATHLEVEILRLHPQAGVHIPHHRPRGAHLNRARLELP